MICNESDRNKRMFSIDNFSSAAAVRTIVLRFVPVNLDFSNLGNLFHSLLKVPGKILRSSVIFLAAFSVVVLIPLAQAGDVKISEREKDTSNDPAPLSSAPDERMVVVNPNTGRVIYDDGKKDKICVTRTFGVPGASGLVQCH